MRTVRSKTRRWVRDVKGANDGKGVQGRGWLVCDGRRGPRDQYVCWGMWTTWVGGGQQSPAADWPAATLTPRPLPHTLS